MRIGILTHHYINNYGAFLQVYALQKALSKLYPDYIIEIINYVNFKHCFINRCGWFRFYKERERLKDWVLKIKIHTVFTNERKKHLKLSHLCLTAKQVNQLNYDIIIIGSDEVWNFKDKRSDSKIKYGIGLNCNNLIAYAPSAGKSSVLDDVPQYVIEGIGLFKSVSARDRHTSDLLKLAGFKKVQVVLDPTFLFDFPHAKKVTGSRPYILFYYCDNIPFHMMNQILNYAAGNSFDVYGAGECNKHYTNNTICITPFEWVEMFKGAAFIFTGTFHGVVFSILNKKQFKVYLTNESRIWKVNDLLELVQIKNRSIDEGFEFDFDKMKYEIDYSLLEASISALKNESIQFLQGSICSSDKDASSLKVLNE